MIQTDFIENGSIALIKMQNGENRLNIDFFVELNQALDVVENVGPIVKCYLQQIEDSRTDHSHNWVTLIKSVLVETQSSNIWENPKAAVRFLKQHLLNKYACKWTPANGQNLFRKPEVKALITTGHGKFYSNGIDLQRLADHPDEFPKFIRVFYATLKRLMCFPIVTIAAVNGHAFAGGAIVALSHDLRVMKTEHGWISLNEVFIQRRIPQELIHLVRSKIPSGPPEHFMFVFGRRFTADEALKAGIVNRTSPGEDLLSESIQLIQEVSGKQEFTREMLQNMKYDVYQDTVDALQTYLDHQSDDLLGSKL